MTIKVSTEGMVDILIKEFPGIQGIHRNNKTVVSLGDAGEGGKIDGEVAAEYWGLKNNGHYLHAKLARVIWEHGYYSEWYDPGTLLAVQN